MLWILDPASFTPCYLVPVPVPVAGCFAQVFVAVPVGLCAANHSTPCAISPVLDSSPVLFHRARYARPMHPTHTQVYLVNDGENPGGFPIRLHILSSGPVGSRIRDCGANDTHTRGLLEYGIKKPPGVMPEVEGLRVV